MLEAWLADLRVDEAAQARAREGWLDRQAAEEATFAGVLADLAERGRAVTVGTATGRDVHGRLRVIGADFCGVRTERGTDVLLRYDAISSVRAAPAADPATGDRLLAPTATLHGALAALAGTGSRLVVTARPGATLAGELRTVGRDVVVLRLDDGRAAYVRLASVAEVSVVESG